MNFLGLTACLYGALLLGAAVEDGRSGEISDGWAIGLFLFGAAVAWVDGALTVHLLSAGVTLLVYGFLYAVSRKSLGTGDICLASATAAWLTPAASLLALWLSAMAALVYVGVLAVLGKFSVSMEIRFAPFIAIGGLVTYGLEQMGSLSALAAWLSFG